MQTTGSHCWGFVIVRTAPCNDDNKEWWDAMLKRIYTDAENTLAVKGYSNLFAPKTFIAIGSIAGSRTPA